MPFTFSHPAIILPLTKLPDHWFSVTGLVAGSMSPDFEYFIRMRIVSSHSHHLPGIFLLDLPLSLVLIYIFQVIVRDSLLKNLPAFMATRLVVFPYYNWPQYFRQNIRVVVLSILIGACSHVFWDAFTHYNGYFVVKWPRLAQPLMLFNWLLPVYKWLQYASTLLGAGIIVTAFIRLPGAGPAPRRKIYPYWISAGLITLLITGIRIAAGLALTRYTDLLVSVITAGFISLILLGLYWQCLNRKAGF